MKMKQNKTKIIKSALKIKGFSYQDYDGNIETLGDLVCDEPTDFIETCIEEAYKEGTKA